MHRWAARIQAQSVDRGSHDGSHGGRMLGFGPRRADNPLLAVLATTTKSAGAASSTVTSATNPTMAPAAAAAGRLLRANLVPSHALHRAEIAAAIDLAAAGQEDELAVANNLRWHLIQCRVRELISLTGTAVAWKRVCDWSKPRRIISMLLAWWWHGKMGLPTSFGELTTQAEAASQHAAERLLAVETQKGACSLALGELLRDGPTDASDVPRFLGRQLKLLQNARGAEEPDGGDDGAAGSGSGSSGDAGAEVHASWAQLKEKWPRLTTSRMFGATPPHWGVVLVVPVTVGVAATCIGWRVWSSYGMRDALANFGKTTLQTAQAFWSTRIWQPLLELYETIRYKGNEGHLALLATQSLQTEIASLKRMVTDFVRDTTGVTEARALAEIEARVVAGDLSPVMQHFESEMRTPVRNLVFGNILRGILIQAQKSKVDMETAMAAIDNMMRAQELNFQLCALIPGLALLYGLIRLVVACVRRVAQGLTLSSELHYRDRLEALNHVARLCSRIDGRDEYHDLQGEGQLLAVLCLVAGQAVQKLSPDDADQLVEDLVEVVAAMHLPDPTLRRSHRLTVVECMRRAALQQQAKHAM
eukprot:m.167954 g.167954  ORF g.167954 m.167954 type:complete len:589 (-) comp17783_c2_seq1:86-1852(-)